MVEVAGLEWAIVSVRYDFFDGDFFEDRLYILYIYIIIGCIGVI